MKPGLPRFSKLLQPNLSVFKSWSQVQFIAVRLPSRTRRHRSQQQTDIFVMLHLIFILSLLASWSSGSFLSGRQHLPPDLLHDLLQPANDGNLLPISRSNDVMRTLSKGDTQPTCDLLPIDRTVAVGATFEGTQEQGGYIDTRNDFFRFALGWNDRRIEQSRVHALKHFKNTFGLDASSLDFNSAAGIYGSDKFGYGVFVVNLTLVRTADSEELTPCTNTTGVLGGWLLFGVDVTYPMVPGVPVEATIPGDSAVYVFYLVSQPGTRSLIKIELRATKPFACVLNTCPIVADAQLIDDPDDMSTGNLDGVFTQVEVAPGVNKEFHNWVLSFPGRK